MSDVERDIEIDGPLSFIRTLGPLSRGRSDPTTKVSETEVLRASRTPEGPATLRLTRPAPEVVRAEAWGEGAAWMVAQAPELIAAERPTPRLADVIEDVAPEVRAMEKKMRGMRLAKTGRVVELLVPTVLEQLVTGVESKRSFRILTHKYGEPAPGPFDKLRLQPAPRTFARLVPEDLFALGVMRQFAATLRRVGHKAHRMEEASSMSAPDAAQRLMALPGIGPWTAGTVMLTGMGHPDAVPVGDYHLPNYVAYTLAGEPRADDDRMLELLEPYRPYRGVVLRYVKSAGRAAPRYGPRREVRPAPFEEARAARRRR